MSVKAYQISTAICPKFRMPHTLPDAGAPNLRFAQQKIRERKHELSTPSAASTLKSVQHGPGASMRREPFERSYPTASGQQRRFKKPLRRPGLRKPFKSA